MAFRSAQAPLALGVAACLALIMGAGVWALRAEIVPAVVAHGIVDTSPGAHPIQHPVGGVVSQVAVREGDWVAAGALLAVLSDPSLDAEQRDLQRQLGEVRARVQRLAAERASEALPPDAPEADFAAFRREARERQRALVIVRQSGLQAQSAALAEQQAALGDDLMLLAADLVVQRRLHDQGLAPLAPVTALEREMTRLRANRAAVAGQRAQLESTIRTLSAEQALHDAQHRVDLEEAWIAASARVAELASRLEATAARQSTLTLRAPVEGRVFGLALGADGVVLRPAEVAMRILAAEDAPTITVQLAPELVRHVAVGQRADLRWRGQGADQPPIAAVVTSIAADAHPDPATGQRLTRVTLRPLLSASAQAPLDPGMTVEAYFLAPPRRPVDYLIGPIVNRMASALREP